MWPLWLGALLLGASAAIADDLSVVKLQLAFEQIHTLDINNNTEYILEFVPTGDQGQWPGRLWVRAASGDPAQPLLLTARRRAGVEFWQLPYRSDGGGQLFHQLEHTMCPDAAAALDAVAVDGTLCGEKASGVWGQFTLHVSTACAKTTMLEVRVSAARDWLLPFDVPASALAVQTAPSVMYYSFAEDQTSVRLTVASDDNVCSIVSVHNYSCPIPHTQMEVERGGLRMTVQRSGGVHLSRSQFPHGFIVVVLVYETDDVCEDEQIPEADWLWEVAVAGTTATMQETPGPRDKRLTLTVTAALSRTQYVVAGAVTVALFLAFYVAFLALVFAQRFDPVARLVGPQAVLADNAHSEEGTTTQVDSSVPTRRRRDSAATFDSSDGSDSDSDESQSPSAPVTPAAPAPLNGTTVSVTDTANSPRVTELGIQQSETPGEVSMTGTPFGLPQRLNVAALAKRRARTIRARSDRYLQTLYTVAVFYALPVLQFVAGFQIILNVSGSLDLCYYNFLCAHPAGMLSDFNHVFSNLGYLLLGALFMLQVRRRRLRRTRKPRHEEYGIPAHYGLLQALGAGMMMVALLSASYHVCPNRLNFQFDTSFMYVLAVLSMVKIYQSRHPDVNARAHATFGVLAVLIALVVWGVLGGGALFWSVFTVLHVFTFLLLSLRIYYVGQFHFDKQGVAEATRGIRDLSTSPPLYMPRLILLVIANAVNWGFALYGLVTMTSDFAGHLLQLLLCNVLMHMLFYLSMKLLNGERLRWYAWAFLAGAAVAWAPALYFFVSGNSAWTTTPAQSRHRNHECMVMQFYDSHDLWHMLSAIALYLSFNAMLTWDDGLSAVKRTEIAVF